MLTLSDHDGRLLMQLLGDHEPTPLHPAEDGSLFAKVPHSTVTFDPHGDAKVVRVTFRQGPCAVDYTRDDKRAATARKKAARKASQA